MGILWQLSTLRMRVRNKTMKVTDQGVQSNRHVAIPRTLVFITSTNDIGEVVVLLLRGAPTKRLWANKYNGLGGHVEPGENVRDAALREVQEETGIVPGTLTLRGVVHIHTGTDDAGSARPGILIFVFRGESAFQSPIATAEGQAEWIPLAQVETLPMVDDLPDLLAHALTGGELFYGRYLPDEDGTFTRHFS